MKGIKNILFDLGGVIFNVDINLTMRAFGQLGAKNFDSIYTQLKQTSLFDDFETGKITAQGFRRMINRELQTDLSDKQVDDAWNAMLLDLPKERMDLIRKFSKKFRLFLLSNTNEIHLPEVEKRIFNSLGVISFNNHFEKEYYSHKIGMRKPNKEFFELVLQENNLKKEETIFVDDTPQHIEGAKKINLQTVFITKEKGILWHFSSWI